MIYKKCYSSICKLDCDELNLGLSTPKLLKNSGENMDEKIGGIIRGGEIWWKI